MDKCVMPLNANLICDLFISWWAKTIEDFNWRMILKWGRAMDHCEVVEIWYGQCHVISRFFLHEDGPLTLYFAINNWSICANFRDWFVQSASSSSATSLHQDREYGKRHLHCMSRIIGCTMANLLLIEWSLVCRYIARLFFKCSGTASLSRETH